MGLILNPYRFAGGGDFDPDSISGLVAWWDATDSGGITVETGGVSAWNNKVDTNSLVQSTSTRRPSTGTRTTNSLNVIDMDNDYMITADFWRALSSSTAFVVAIGDASAGADSISGVIMESDGAFDIYGLRFNGSSSKAEFIHYDGSTQLALESTTSPYSSWHVYTVVDQGTSAQLRVDGVQEDSASYTRSTLTLSFFRLGYNDFFGGIRYLDGAIAEVLIYDGVLSSTDRDAVEDYLTTKWGL